MRFRAIALLTASVIAYGSTPAVISTASAAPPRSSGSLDASGPSVDLRIDTTKLLPDEREHVAGWIREDGNKTLTEAGVVIEPQGAEYEVRVSVASEEIDYVVEASIWRTGAQKPEVRRGRTRCPACNRTELLELIDRELMWVGGWLSDRPSSEEGTSPADEPSSPSPGEPQRVDGDADPDESSAADAERPPPLGALGKSGIGVFAVGGAGLIAGGIVFARGRLLAEDRRELLLLEGQDYRPAGIALMVAGGVVAVTGASLLLTDRLVGRQERSRPTVRVLPAHNGLTLIGRF